MKLKLALLFTSFLMEMCGVVIANDYLLPMKPDWLQLSTFEFLSASIGFFIIVCNGFVICHWVDVEVKNGKN